MGKRRFAQVPMSDDEDDAPCVFVRPKSSTKEAGGGGDAELSSKRRRIVKPPSAEDEVEGSKREVEHEKKDVEGAAGLEEEDEQEDEEEEEEVEDAKPIGEPVRVSGKGRGRREHYEAFEYDGNRYELEDPVLLVPEERDQKPYVAIIKDITQTKSGNMMVTGQWFYRPEEAEKKGGGSWQSRDTRELFYSFHRDEVPAESVMHKCVVHFVPIHKQLPTRKQHPGFIVQKVYDTVERKLWKLTDKDYEDNKQHEIDLLVQKTLSRLGDLPDIEPEEVNPEQEEPQLKSKRSFRRRNMSPIDVSREEDATTQQLRAETPGSCLNSASEHVAILAKFNALTGDTHRDKCLEKLLQGVQYVCNPEGSKNEGDKRLVGSTGSVEKETKDNKRLVWPDDAVSAVTALEKASHDALSSDSQKYNQKLRQLVFNLKNNAVLARRLLNGELEPAKILNMSPTELKEGLTAEETATKEPEESNQMQMTDCICSRCREFKVGVRDIIHAGHGDRYQLECTSCGHSWYASRDAVSMLTIDGPGAATSVGAAPWATAKFENVEKQLASPRGESGKPSAANDAFKKGSEPFMPVLERQKSMGNRPTSKATDEGSETSKKGE
ncbi:hypothetical protein CRG98_028692 [Punica granatum]|uniref:BAH domain-containing protein n=1 Tax=Punica granatum TaxID=22663 RepID=A0A2I0J419_PUNGR|nr:hypothetical protein CRG98_028692 [Punica granatum]